MIGLTWPYRSLRVRSAAIFCSDTASIGSHPGEIGCPMWHFLYFFPLPQGHGAFRPTLLPIGLWQPLLGPSFRQTTTGQSNSYDADRKRSAGACGYLNG